MLMPLYFLCASLGLLHPLLRSLGVPNHCLPLDVLQKANLQWTVRSLGVRARIEGARQLVEELKGSPAVFLFSHSSNLDPPVVAACCPISIKFIGKKTLFQIPIFGRLFRLYGNISIDRHNIKSAIESLDEAAEAAQKCQRSIAIAPEGTRSRVWFPIIHRHHQHHHLITISRVVN